MIAVEMEKINNPKVPRGNKIPPLHVQLISDINIIVYLRFAHVTHTIRDKPSAMIYLQ